MKINFFLLDIDMTLILSNFNLHLQMTLIFWTHLDGEAEVETN